MGRFLPILLHDPYPAVRRLAARSLRKLPGFEGLEYSAEFGSLGRILVRDRAIAQWRERRAASGVADSDDPAALPDEVVAELLAKRDLRPLTLRE
jgi:hypothetical protein